MGRRPPVNKRRGVESSGQAKGTPCPKTAGPSPPESEKARLVRLIAALGLRYERDVHLFERLAFPTRREAR
jgi:hypothetical protein